MSSRALRSSARDSTIELVFINLFSVSHSDRSRYSITYSGCPVHLGIAIQFRSQSLGCQILVDLLRIGTRDKLDNDKLVGMERRVESGKK